MSDELDRLPPHDLDAEAALVGSLLLDRDAIIAVADWVTPDAFYHGANGIIFRAVRGLYQAGYPADLVTLTDFLANRKLLGQAGGLAYISGLLTAVPTAVHVEYYAEIVMRLARRRALIDEGAKLVGLGWAGDVPLDDALGILRRIEERFPPREREGAALAETIETLRDAALGRWDGTYVERLTTLGLPSVEKRMLGGARPGDLIYVGGRPGSGKTSLALQIARHVAGAGKIVCFAELEMDREMLLSRMISHEARVPFAVPFSHVGDVKQRDEWLLASERIAELARGALRIEKKKRTTDQLTAWVEKARSEGDVGALIVDHLDLLADPDLAGQSIEQKTAQTSKRLKRIAMDAGIPVIALSQLNRAVEASPPFRPDMAHLRYSGGVEQDADYILLLYRRRYYVEKQRLDPDDELDWLPHSNQHRVELIVAKARNGQTGTLEFGWIPDQMRFQERAA